jgi:FtsH-binding integral membrane protein
LAAPLRATGQPNAMLILRIFGALLVITLGVSLVGYVVTRDRRWLRFTARALVIGIVIALILMVLYALERLVVAV